MAQIVVFPRGQLTAQDRKTLRAAGVVPIEADEPKAVVVVVPLVDHAGMVEPNDIMMSLLNAVAQGYDSASKEFVVELRRRLVARERATDSPAATPRPAAK